MGDAGLGIVIDIVPNHMGTGDTRNRWWGQNPRSSTQRGDRLHTAASSLRNRRTRRGGGWSARKVFDLVHGKGAIAGARGWIRGKRVDPILGRAYDWNSRHKWSVLALARSAPPRVGQRRIMHTPTRKPARLAEFARDGGYEFLNDGCALSEHGGGGKPSATGPPFEGSPYEAQCEQARGTFTRAGGMACARSATCPGSRRRAALPSYRTYVEQCETGA